MQSSRRIALPGSRSGNGKGSQARVGMASSTDGGKKVSMTETYMAEGRVV